MELTIKEQMLIEMLRRVGFGKIEVSMHNAEPQSITVREEHKIMLTEPSVMQFAIFIRKKEPGGIDKHI
jgi:hypothetical protein